MTDSTTAATKDTQPRWYFFDWLRVIAIGFLFMFHSGMPFVGWGWHIVDSQVVRSLELPMDIAHRLRMPLLFVIAGASVWLALGRRGAWQVLRERAKRLLLPLVFGMLVIVPPQVYIERLFRPQWDGDGYLDFYWQRVLQFKPYPQGDFAWHHLWFIAYLFIYILLLLPVLAWWRSRRAPVLPGWWLLLLGLPLGLNEALLKRQFPETHALFYDWYTLGHYALLFAFGFLLAWLPGTWDWLQQRRHRLLAVAAALTATIFSLKAVNVWHNDTTHDAIGACFFVWWWQLVFLGYGRQLLSFRNRALDYLSEASYPLYILHQSVMVVLAWFVLSQPWVWQQKYLALLFGTLAISLLIYEALVRRVPVLRLLFGLKPMAPNKPQMQEATAGAGVADAEIGVRNP
ncbi:MAG TPA: acyltransferase family protein [Candidatus Acidoferrum sp.]|nr:acyltransferase family protein [Candidatus Acidoferrum sp.]